MTEAEAIKDSIAHWERMIAWAKKQPKKDAPSGEVMETAIGEHWGNKYCALCKEYLGIGTCRDCPLAKKYGECGSYSYNNAWYFVAGSRMWGEWLKNAERMLEQLRSLL